jgi:2-haloacid dehalogenase
VGVDDDSQEPLLSKREHGPDSRIGASAPWAVHDNGSVASTSGDGDRGARWATFDCYGTLVDWNRGIGVELERLFAPGEAEALLARYHAIEPEVQRERPSASYREVMATVLERLGAERGRRLPTTERDALARSLPAWPVFEEVPAALGEARRRGWRLAILSNSDRDLIEASIAAIGVPVELAVVASEIGSYKPAPGHWRAFYERSGAERSRHVHVGASLFHDIDPAARLGVASIWVNRLGERATVEPSLELPELSWLADALEELVAAG